MLRLILVCLLAAGCKSDKADPKSNETPKPAPADAAAKKPDKPAPPPAYRAALRKGRALVAAKKYIEAVAAFREGLAVVEGDPRTSSELSLALYLAKDYPGAEKAARESIARATGKLKAASLYNLALALLKQSKKEDAVTALRRSIALRPHEVVAKKLAKLTGSKEANPLAPAAWEGPFEDIAAFCAAQEDKDLSGWKCPHEKRPIKLSGSAVFKEGIDLVLNEENHSGHVLLRTDKGWFGSPLYYEFVGIGMYDAEGKVLGAEIKKRGGVDVLRLDMEMMEEERYGQREGKLTWFCGAPAGEVKCTPAIFSELTESWFNPFAEEEADDESESNEYKFTIAIDDAGELTVTAKGKVSGDLRAQVGTHKLAF